MNRDFLLTTFDGLKDGFKKCCKSVADFLGNLGMIAGSCIGALTAGVIAYSAFLFLPFGSIVAGIPALVNFTLYFATGYVSIKSHLKKLMDSRNPDIQAQKECIDKLKHLKKEYFNKINEFLASEHTNDILQELQQKDLAPDRAAELNTRLNGVLNDLVEQPLNDLKALGETIINDKTNAEIAAAWAGTVFDISLAALALLPTFITFTQAGFKGFSLIEGFAGGTVLEKASQAAKITIGAVPGILSCAFYGLVDLGFRQTLINLAKRLYHNPHEIPGAMTLLTMNALGSSGMENIAEGVMLNPDNIFGIEPNTFGKVYVALNAAAAGTTNTVLTVNPSYMNESDPNAADLANLISYMEKVQLPHDIIEKLKKTGLFAVKPAAKDGYVPVPDVEVAGLNAARA